MGNGIRCNLCNEIVPSIQGSGFYLRTEVVYMGIHRLNQLEIRCQPCELKNRANTEFPNGKPGY